MSKQKSTRSTSVPTISSLTDGPTLKRSKDDLVHSSDEEEVASLKDLWIKMRTMVAAETERIRVGIGAQIDRSTGELRQRIEGLESQLADLKKECTTNVSNLQKDIVLVKNELQLSLECTKKLEIDHELVISGVPYLENEDLGVLYGNICSALGYTEPPLAKLTRLARPPIKCGASPLLLCEFALRSEKSNFYRTYLRYRSLTLRHAGFENDGRIFINENLSLQARAIRTEAIKLKKKGLIDTVRTRNGTIFVKPAGSSTFEPIYRAEQLPGQSSITLS